MPMPAGTLSEARPIILASQSPRRVDLLREAGIAFEAVSPVGPEPDMNSWPSTPEEFARSASCQKAGSVAARYPDRVILGADTVVALNGRIYGKPADRDEARQILSSLAGVAQDVITGVTILHPAKGRQITECDVTRVTMRPMSAEEIEAYLDSGEWEGKAGAYGIQGTADRFVEKVEGSFSNVVGLPVEMVVRMLAAFGVHPE